MKRQLNYLYAVYYSYKEQLQQVEERVTVNKQQEEIQSAERILIRRFIREVRAAIDMAIESGMHLKQNVKN